MLSDFDPFGATQVGSAMLITPELIKQKVKMPNGGEISDAIAEMLASKSAFFPPNTIILKEDVPLTKMRYFQPLSGFMHIGHMKLVKIKEEVKEEMESFCSVDGSVHGNAVIFPEKITTSSFMLFSGSSGCIVLMLDASLMKGMLRNPTNALNATRNITELYRQTCNEAQKKMLIKHYMQPLFNMLFQQVVTNSEIAEVVFQGLMTIYLKVTTPASNENNAEDVSEASVLSVMEGVQKVYQAIKAAPPTT